MRLDENSCISERARHAQAFRTHLQNLRNLSGAIDLPQAPERTIQCDEARFVESQRLLLTHSQASPDRAERLCTKIYTTISLLPNNFRWLTKNKCDTVPRIMDHEMVPHPSSHPTQSSITTFRTFLLITILAVGCALSAFSLLFAAELFPYAPPSSSQQRSAEQQPAARPQLSSEDLDRISKIAAKARGLNPSDKQQLKSSIQRSLDEAVAKGNLNQAQYFNELLRQID